MYDRDWVSPVSLTREYPVTQYEVHCRTSDSTLFDDMWCFFLQYRRFLSVPFSGIDHGSDSICISLCHVLNLFTVFCNYLDDRDIELCSEFKVTIIVSRYTHDCSCTIVSQYIIRQPDRNFCSVDRIDRIASCEDTCLFFILHTVYVRLHRSIVNVLLYCFSCLIVCKTLSQFMLWCQNHECCSV